MTLRSVLGFHVADFPLVLMANALLRTLIHVSTRYQISWDAAPDTSARTSRRPTEAVAGAAPLGSWRRSGRRRLKSVGARRRDEIPTHMRVSIHLESCIITVPRLFLRGREQPGNARPRRRCVHVGVPRLFLRGREQPGNAVQDCIKTASRSPEGRIFGNDSLPRMKSR
eukprot:scaffold72859_cov51-Phaeocystis_antarctica.AAC.2